MEENKIYLGLGRYGLDLIQRVISFDNETQTYTLAFKPDPRRYEWREVDGRIYLYDRFFDTSLSEEDYYELTGQLLGEPVYHELSDMDNAGDYIKKWGWLIVVKRKRSFT